MCKNAITGFAGTCKQVKIQGNCKNSAKKDQKSPKFSLQTNITRRKVHISP